MRMSDKPFLRLGGVRDVETFQRYLRALHISIPCDQDLIAGDASPLAKPLQVDHLVLGNRFAIQPMEGWDGTLDGRPTELTFRRWRRFGASGAKLIWGGEAVAVCHDGRANPHQLLSSDQTHSSLEHLRRTLVQAHEQRCGSSDDLLVGLQLTHSGRFARPNRKDRLEPS